MFSKRGLVNLKFFLVFTVLILLFTISLTHTLKEMVINVEVEELYKMAVEMEKRGGDDIEMSCSSPTFLGATPERDGEYEYLLESDKDGRDHLVVRHHNIVVERDITDKNSIILNIILLIFMLTIGLIILTFLYSHILSKDTREPIQQLNRYLENISEKELNKIPVEKLPEDLHLLAETINDLLNRVEVFIGTQKELFIGASHELKTPLAVIKLKNQVLLMKERAPKEYIETIQLTNEKIDEMNAVVSDVLNIGRQESAQFESPVERDVIKILQKKSQDFSLLAQSQGKNFITLLQPDEFIASIQETLLNHIIQNFLQNALKFTPQGKKIELQSYINEDGYLTIEVIDEGVGIDEKQDIFAPFNRKGNKSGVGLGLFLAKSAADSMGAKISVKNRKDGDGAIASLELKSKLVCLL